MSDSRLNNNDKDPAYEKEGSYIYMGAYLSSSKPHELTAQRVYAERDKATFFPLFVEAYLTSMITDKRRMIENAKAGLPLHVTSCFFGKSCYESKLYKHLEGNPEFPTKLALLVKALYADVEVNVTVKVEKGAVHIQIMIVSKY